MIPKKQKGWGKLVCAGIIALTLTGVREGIASIVVVTDVKIIRGELAGGWFEVTEEVDQLTIGDVFVIRTEVSNIGNDGENVASHYRWELFPQNRVEVIGGPSGCATYYDLQPDESAFLNPFCSSYSFKAESAGAVTMNISVHDWNSSKLCDYTFDFMVIPEPATFGLLGIGLVSLLTRKRKKKAHCAAIVALVMLAGATGGKANTVPVNANSTVQDGIEYYMQTDKFVYNLGESVQMLYRVKNLGDMDVEFRFSYGPIDNTCNWMVDKNELRIWDNLGRPATGVITWFVLNPSESKEYTQFWSMSYNNGDPIMPGIYDITGVLSYYTGYERYVPVSVQVEIIPEPTSLLFLGMGCAGLLVRRRNKN